jgi:hypothetical protein
MFETDMNDEHCNTRIIKTGNEKEIWINVNIVVLVRYNRNGLIEVCVCVCVCRTDCNGLE